LRLLDELPVLRPLRSELPELRLLLDEEPRRFRS
jgi:hypothetical protein